MAPSLPSPTADLRALRRRRTRDELCEAALELFEDQGYGETSIEEIAARVLLSPRTFYRYFPAKEDVVFWGLPRGDEGLAQLLRDLPELSAADCLEQALLFVAERLEGVDDARRKLSLAEGNPQLQAQVLEGDRAVEAVLAADLRERLSAASSAADALAASAVAVYRGAVRRWTELAGGRRLTTLVRQGLGALRPALDAAEG